MALIDINVPQMGEGLTEVRLLEFMKSPGDSVARDEILYTMETDKATLEVESPESGVLSEWLAAEGDILPIGATIARIEQQAAMNVSASPVEANPIPAPQTAVASRERVIPPRTRAYARELGITDAILAQIPSVTGKLMPSDIDTFKAAETGTESQPNQEVSDAAPLFLDKPLTDRQRKLNFHMKRSAQLVIPGTISRPVAWHKVLDFAASARLQSDSVRPTEFQTFAYCAVKATESCPKFRSMLIREDTVRQFDRLTLGAAVALPDGDLSTAVVPDANTLSFFDFAVKLHQSVQAVRAGEDQAAEGVHLLLTYLGAHGVRDAVPVLVAPAAAVIFLGETYENADTLYANVVITFDHRLMNGVEAANMLTAIANEIDSLSAGE